MFKQTALITLFTISIGLSNPITPYEITDDYVAFPSGNALQSTSLAYGSQTRISSVEAYTRLQTQITGERPWPQLPPLKLKTTVGEDLFSLIKKNSFVAQGKALFSPESPTDTEIKIIHSVCNCVGFMARSKIGKKPYALMHIDDASFASGRFGRLLDKFSSEHKSSLDVLIFTPYQTSLLRNVFDTLNDKEINPTHFWTTPTLFDGTHRYCPVSVFSTDLGEIAKQDFNDLAELYVRQGFHAPFEAYWNVATGSFLSPKFENAELRLKYFPGVASLALSEIETKFS